MLAREKCGPRGPRWRKQPTVMGLEVSGDWRSSIHLFKKHRAARRRCRWLEVVERLHTHSPTHVFVQKGEHVGLPNAHPEMDEVVPIVHRVPDGRIDLQTMRFADPLAAGVQHLA